MNYSQQTPLESYLCGYTAERVIYSGFFGDKDLAVFSKLIIGRRALPIYLGDCWRCYDCIFESSDFEDMANHIMKVHKPTLVDEVEEEIGIG